MKSLQQKVGLLTGLLGTKDISEWEAGFIETLQSRLEARVGQVVGLSQKQEETLDQLYAKHFS